jgi:UDP-N-acetylmuramate--alanine ligase
MTALPLSIGTIHFVGIGGIGMSGIAEILHNLGYHVQGSDMSENANVRRLRAKGIAIAIEHKAENIGDAQVVVMSSAVKADNPEISAARARLIPVVRRAEMLAELMRLKWSVAVGGTHGKTTTTSMIAAVFDAAGLDPTVINGGIINSYGTNARLGAGEWMVVEADESDGTFVKLPATIAVVTNIDPEHLDYFGDYDSLKRAFVDFVENIPFYGFCALCLDHPEVQAMIPRVSDRKVITYGLSPQADVRAINVALAPGGARFDVVCTDRARGEEHAITDFRLPMVGEHNVQNSLAAIAVAREMGIPEDVMRRALASFGGVGRRFTKTGEWNGIAIIDDYGHHPVEIAAVLKGARAISKGRIIAVVQPHRYSRLKNLFEGFCSCFNDADSVVVADVYPAGEAPIEGVDRDALVAGLRAHGHRNVLPLSSPDALADVIAELARPGDMVICLGAGSITTWAHALPEELAHRDGGKAPGNKDSSEGGNKGNGGKAPRGTGPQRTRSAS